MRQIFLLGLCWSGWLASTAWSQQEPNQFEEPDGGRVDFSQKYAVGETMNIRWKEGWFGWTQLEDPRGPERADLWITSYHDWSYEEVLLANTTTREPGTFSWKINVTEEALNARSTFVLRFRPQSDDYTKFGGLDTMSPSRGFLITAPNPPPSSASVAATTTSTKSPSTISSASPSTSATSSQASPQAESETNIGAIVGGVIGGLAVITLAAIAFFLWRIWKRKRDAAAVQTEYGNTGAYLSGYSTTMSDEKYRADGHAAKPTELPAFPDPVEAGVGRGGGGG